MPWSFFRYHHTSSGNHTLCHTSFLWQVLVQKVIFSPYCWNKTQHILEQVPLKSFKLHFLVSVVDFIGTFLNSWCQVWYNIPLRKEAKCKHKCGCHGMIQRLFQSMNGGDRKWEIGRGMWLVSLALQRQHGTLEQDGIFSVGTVETNYYCNLL